MRRGTKTILPSPALYVRRTKRMGFGVYAGERIRKGAIIEVCPVVPLSRADERKAQSMVLRDYTFAWGQRPCLSCVVLGWGAVYNHSDRPNATYQQRKRRQQMIFVALRDIEKDEQIFIDYEWEANEYELTGIVPRQSRRSRNGRR